MPHLLSFWTLPGIQGLHPVLGSLCQSLAVFGVCFGLDPYSLVKTPLDVWVELEGMTLPAVTFLLSPMSDIPRWSFKHLDCLCCCAHLLKLCLGSVPQLGFPVLQDQAQSQTFGYQWGLLYVTQKDTETCRSEEELVWHLLGQFSERFH